ncbi:hypothetical protein ACFYU5_35955 [Nocardia aobensis]|uniref:GCVT N-terminal domain-containing protein n=1 Tax=Nocardia aobensis TaxID=257277 RepID=A0ABW6PF74_9NOCA
MFPSLEQKIQESGGNPARMLRSLPANHHAFLYAPEYTTWFNEQTAWADSCVLFDQSHHMSDLTIKGPDAKRLISDTGVNSVKNLTRNRAKQYVAVGPDGDFIGDAVLFCMEEDEIRLIGPMVGSWVDFQAQHGGYDVELRHDPTTLYHPTGQRDFWRYQLNGPLTQQIVEKAAGGPIGRIPFFQMGEFEIAGTPVRALNHTMSGVPGDEYTGLELWGPAEHARRVLDTLMQAGAEFGLRRGGGVAYISSNNESGWIPAPVPAIYTHPELKAYRESVSAFSIEANLGIEGSFASDDIEDYYHTPWDLGYGRFIKFDHDFIGRSALEERAAQPHRKKVWLEWNSDDVVRVMRDSLFGEEPRPKILSIPNPIPNTAYHDSVHKGDEFVGLSIFGGYTVNIRQMVTMAVVDEPHAYDGNQVTITWGEPDGGTSRAFMAPHHTQTNIRASVRTTPPTHH